MKVGDLVRDGFMSQTRTGVKKIGTVISLHEIMSKITEKPVTYAEVLWSQGRAFSWVPVEIIEVIDENR